jgi:acetyl esterase/lipase
MVLPITKRQIAASALLLGPGLIVSLSLALRRAGMAVLYKPAPLPDHRVKRDISYRHRSDDPKHRLDLFLPEGTDWPVLLFIHGGGLACGDKALRVCGADVYGNIGRFYASRGIGVAVISYRLQPKVTWREQVQDVAHATAWIYSHIGSYGGDSSQVFISGHSAGAHLAARVALDPQPLAELGLSPGLFSGVIAVSGAAYDLADTMTYDLGQKLRHYEMRFRRGDATEKWKKEASPITYVAPGAPPFLILYGEREFRSLKRQSQLLHEALQRHRVSSRVVVVPGQNHCRIVLTLSRPDKISAPAILRFMTELSMTAVPVSGAAQVRGTSALQPAAVVERF